MQFFFESLAYLRDLLLMMPPILAHRIDPLEHVRITETIDEEVRRILLELSSRMQIAKERYPAPEADSEALQEDASNSATFSATLEASSPPLSVT